ncbi:MAG: cobyric acid synthase [Methanomicrobiaceae archaeon]|nr:cobyric acid synthase [Methanomicrobiaceae archaeon]
MSLMILGSSSHAGKSTVVAAICRCLYNNGYSCAPFKSQNMSLNSYVTNDGEEIGIAQAIQAMAAGVEPTSEMNPVLLKPKGDRTSQVVLLGKPYKDIKIGEYYKETDYLLDIALKSYYSLEEKYGNIVVEGAGGAAEINLYNRDIANILLAKRLNIPIIIVGDIERGGIFAQLIGTYQLLPEDVKKNVKGFIINKFRGDPSLFDEGVSIIEEKTGIKVLGVLPYSKFELPSEDSLSIQDKKNSEIKERPVKIGVVKLDRISNFSDFEPLERYADIHYIDPSDSFDHIDCLILPGTKNTIDDLKKLKSLGFDKKLKKMIERKILIFGICGGFQMLGNEITDSGIESGNSCNENGFGLLDIKTEFSTYDKTTIKVRRKSSGKYPVLSKIDEASGYEIHMGRTNLGDDVTEAFEGDGAVSQDGLIIGTYMHGLFNNNDMICALMNHLYEQKGLEFSTENLPETSIQNAFEELYKQFKENVNVDDVLDYFNK